MHICYIVPDHLQRLLDQTWRSHTLMKCSGSSTGQIWDTTSSSSFSTAHLWGVSDMAEYNHDRGHCKQSHEDHMSADRRKPLVWIHTNISLQDRDSWIKFQTDKRIMEVSKGCTKAMETVKVRLSLCFQEVEPRRDKIIDLPHFPSYICPKQRSWWKYAILWGARANNGDLRPKHIIMD